MIHSFLVLNSGDTIGNGLLALKREKYGVECASEIKTTVKEYIEDALKNNFSYIARIYIDGLTEQECLSRLNELSKKQLDEDRIELLKSGLEGSILKTAYDMAKLHSANPEEHGYIESKDMKYTIKKRVADFLRHSGIKDNQLLDLIYNLTPETGDSIVHGDNKPANRIPLKPNDSWVTCYIDNETMGRYVPELDVACNLAYLDLSKILHSNIPAEFLDGLQEKFLEQYLTKNPDSLDTKLINLFKAHECIKIHNNFMQSGKENKIRQAKNIKKIILNELDQLTVNTLDHYTTDVATVYS